MYAYHSLCTTVVHNTAQNRSDNFPSYPPDNHHSSDDVWRGGGTTANYCKNYYNLPFWICATLRDTSPMICRRNFSAFWRSSHSVARNGRRSCIKTCHCQQCYSNMLLNNSHKEPWQNLFPSRWIIQYSLSISVWTYIQQDNYFTPLLKYYFCLLITKKFVWPADEWQAS